jgi:hypothetical protein
VKSESGTYPKAIEACQAPSAAGGKRVKLGETGKRRKREVEEELQSKAVGTKQEVMYRTKGD